MKITVYPFLFTLDHYTHEVAEGTTIPEMLNMLPHLSSNGSIRVYVNGDLKSDGALQSEDVVVVRAVPRGAAESREQNDFQRVGGAITAFVGLILTPIAPPLGLALLAVGATALVAGEIKEKEYLYGPTTSTDSNGKPTTFQRPEIRGASNSASPNAKLPCILGKHRITPYYAAFPYTTLATTQVPGDGMVLNMLFAVGYGPLRLTDFRLGQSLLATNSTASTTVPQDGAVTMDGMFEANTTAIEIAQPASYSTVNGKFTGAATALPAAYDKVVYEEQVNAPLAGFVPMDPAIPNNATNPPRNMANMRVDVVAANGSYGNATTFKFYFSSGNLANRGIRVGRVIGFKGFANAANNNTFLISQVDEANNIAVSFADRGRAVTETGTLTVNAWSGEANFRYTAKNTTEITVMVAFPEGLAKWTESTKSSFGVEVVPFYRARVTSGTQNAWIRFPNEWSADSSSQVITGSYDTTVRYSNTVSGLTAGEYEVRVEKLTADNVIDADPKVAYYHKCTWMLLQAKSGQDVLSINERKNVVLVALKVAAGAQINGTVDKFNCIAEAMYPASPWNVSSLSTSRNIADAYRWLLRGPYNPRPITDDAKIDYTTIAALSARDIKYDAVLQGSGSMLDTLNGVLQAGRASFTMKDGLYSLVQDVSNATVTMHITPANSRDFSATKTYRDVIHGYKIKFINESNDYADDERVVIDDGYVYDFDGAGTTKNWAGVAKNVGDPVGDGTFYALATEFENLSVQGLVEPSAVGAWGRYALAVRRLRPETITCVVDAEQLVATRGDRVQVNHDVMLWGSGWGVIKSLVRDGSNNVTGFTLDNYIGVTTGTTYAVRFRTYDGTITRNLTAMTTGSYNTFTLASNIASGTTLASGDLAQVGPTGVESIPCLIVGIENYDDLSARVTLVEYNEAIYTADSSIPAFSSKVTQRAPLLTPLANIDLSVAQSERRTGNQAVSVVGGVSPKYSGAYGTLP